MKKITIITIFSLLNIFAFGQNTILQDYFNSVASGKRKSIAKSDMQTLYSDDLIQEEMAVYLNDPTLRWDAIRLLGRIGNGHQHLEVRQKTIHQLLDIALEKDPKTMATIIDKLINFKKADFDDKALMMVDSVLYAKPTHLKDLVLLGGFLEREKVLNELAPQYKNNRKISRNIGFALSRCGNKRRILSLLASLENVPKDDAFVHQIAPMLIYVRQKETFDYLLEIIKSNEKNCQAGGDHGRRSVLCGYRVMEMVAPYIIDFPIPIDEYGDVNISNYQEDLTKVRAWMMVHFDDYELRRERY